MYYLFGCILLLNCIVFFMPKRLPFILYYSTALFALLYEVIINLYLDVKYDLFGFFRKGVDWEYLYLFVGIIPQVNAIFVNFFPFDKSLKHKVIYIITSSIVLTVWEWITSFTWVFYYNGWNVWMSLLVYPLIQTIIIANVYFTKYLLKQSVT